MSLNTDKLNKLQRLAPVRSSDLLADGQILCAGDAMVACPLFQAEYGGSKPTSALQLKISKCHVKHACKLNEMWHSRLPLLDWSSVVRHRFTERVARHSMQRVVRGEQNQPNKNMSRESSKAIERAKRLAAMSPAEQRTALAAEKTGIKQMTLQEKLDDEMQKLEESYRSAQAANEYRRCDRLQGAMDTINNLQTWLNVARLSEASNAAGG